MHSFAVAGGAGRLNVMVRAREQAGAQWRVWMGTDARSWANIIRSTGINQILHIAFRILYLYNTVNRQ
eukprot:COSAG02_NODE_1187_length_14003_cov_48.566240_1_plen_68_part_00